MTAALTSQKLESTPVGRPYIAPLALAAVGTVVGLAGVEAAAIAMSGDSRWWSGWLAALIVSLLATLVSLVPLSLGLAGDTQHAAYGFLGSILARLLSTIFGMIAAVFIFHVPAFAALLLIVPLYLAALIAECAILWRAFAFAGKSEGSGRP